jgi:hypothetical protein
MKYILACLATMMVFSFANPLTGINDKERKDAIEYFKETQKFLEKETKGLSEAQLNWKPADSVWSIANCIEHIALSEQNLFDWAMQTMKTPADPSKKSSVKVTDEDIKKMVSDRSVKRKAREGFIPSGQFGDAAGSLRVFNERRENLINYMKTTTDDLRNHFSDSPAGTMDAYQILFLLSAHTKRHTLQIVELKAMPGFPKS